MMPDSLKTLIRTGLCLISGLFIYSLWSSLENIGQDRAENNVEELASVSDNPPVVIADKNRILPGSSEFDEIIRRPLFNDDRLPFVYVTPEKSDSKKTKKTAEQYRLNAVVITPEKQIAIIKSSKNKESLRISLGESIDDWILNEVTHHSVQLKKGNKIKILELEIKISAKRPKTKNKIVPKDNKKDALTSLKDKNAEIDSIKSLKEKIAQAKKDAATAKK